MKHNTRSWKHTSKSRKQYGEYNSDKYNTDFMLDELVDPYSEDDDEEEMAVA